MELPKDCKHNGCAQEVSGAADAEGRVVCSGLELKQVLLLDMMPNCTSTLTLNNKRSQMKTNGSFSGISLLKRLLWSILPLETILISVVCAVTTRGHNDIHDQCYQWKPCKV